MLVTQTLDKGLRKGVNHTWKPSLSRWGLMRLDGYQEGRRGTITLIDVGQAGRLRAQVATWWWMAPGAPMVAMISLWAFWRARL